jgi:hypothetical protein
MYDEPEGRATATDLQMYYMQIKRARLDPAFYCTEIAPLLYSHCWGLKTASDVSANDLPPSQAGQRMGSLDRCGILALFSPSQHAAQQKVI